jgi:chromosome segregation ATPase
MGRPGITYDDVAKTAQALQTQGVNPTIERIRTTLGTGSNGTITLYLRQWRAKASDLQQLASKEQLPESLVTLIKSLWRHMLDETEGQIEEVKKGALQTLTELKQRCSDLETHHQQLQQRYNQLQRTKDEIDRDKLTLTSGLSELKQTNTITQVQLENAKKQLQEKQERINELNGLNKQVQENLEHYRNSIREQRVKEEQEHEAQKDQWHQRIKNLEIELSATKEAGEKLGKLYNENSFQHEQVKREFNKLVGDHKTLDENNKFNEKEIITYQSVNKHLEKENKLFKEEIKKQQEQLISLQKELAARSQKLSIEEEKNKTLTTQVELFSHDKWILGQEKAQLVGQLRQIDIICDKQSKQND